MGIIKVLPETVQNKIAAGEVIERPASVVKELAENALDAGATLVEIELEEGGHRLIRVSDNGSGMGEADLVACMQRHATSKISDVDDIFRIATFGFRGEALPSIGSVSRMSIVTGTDPSETGHELLIEGGQLVRLSPAPPRKGTRVEVRDIFFNTPARRKFLRLPASEGTRTAEIVTRLALGNPGAGFRFQNGDRITLAVRPAASQLARIGEIFGKQLADRMVEFKADIADGLSVWGCFARPPHNCKTSKDIYILVNRRWIRYYGLAKAVGDAFEGILPPRCHPFAIVNLDVDPARVDVNVHPAKEEVRFEQERILVGGVKNAIRNALAGVASMPTAASVSAAAPAATSVSEPFRPPEPAKPSAQGRLDLPASFARPAGKDFSPIDLAAARDYIRGNDKRPSAPFRPENPAPERIPSAPPRPEAAAERPQRGGELPVGQIGHHRVVGQVAGKYILIDSPDGLLMVDPHALHERWNYDRLMDERKKGASGKRLLLPLEIDLSPAEAEAAVEAVPSLAEYGFEFAMPEPNHMTVMSAPSFVPPARLENLVRQVLADVSEAGPTLEALRERLLASLACRSSVLLGRTLPEGEMLSLLDRFFHQGQLPTCPHGRPTAIRIDWSEVDRRFGR